MLMLLVGYFVIPHPYTAPATIFSVVIVFTLTMVQQYFNVYIKLFCVWCGFIILVMSGRFLGGATIEILLTDSMGSISLLLAVSTALMAFGAVSPRNLLKTLDYCRVPRNGSYIILSIKRLTGFVKHYGKRQVEFTKIKGMMQNSYLSRIRCYRKILGPLFATLLDIQLANSRSLFFRRFFSSKYSSDSTVYFVGKSAIWSIAALIINFVIWYGLSKWIG
jgi:hypothetical protein